MHFIRSRYFTERCMETYEKTYWDKKYEDLQILLIANKGVWKSTTLSQEQCALTTQAISHDLW